MTDVSDQNAIYPFELIVEGTPISLQAKGNAKELWKATVREAGQKRAAETDPLGFLWETAVAMTIYYLPSAPMEGDVDNIVKPIMDALINVAYKDDHFVERVSVQKLEPYGGWNIFDPSEQLAKALELQPPVVYVHVTDDLSWREIR